ncbi:MAG: site-2 protease family protein [Ectothiorhodospiraceae bacterium]|jgi:Zn-dependent protease|nr:site-2 protease family protein [Ectothiorhodospiraceae bacterium]
MDQVIQTIAIWALPVLLAITLHEVSHGWVARMLGDPTAQMLGRLTLNPLKHIDPIGTIAVPLGLVMLSVLTSGPMFVFGWAKPVPVNVRNLHRPQRDMALVAAAGPLSNLAMALGWALLLKLSLLVRESGIAGVDWVVVPLAYMGMAGIAINILLMVLNLLPVPPLDGGRVLSGLVSPRLSSMLDRIEPYGLIIMVVLLVTGLLGAILWPFYEFFVRLIHGLFALPF